MISSKIGVSVSVMKESDKQTNYVSNLSGTLLFIINPCDAHLSWLKHYIYYYEVRLLMDALNGKTVGQWSLLIVEFEVVSILETISRECGLQWRTFCAIDYQNCKLFLHAFPQL